MNVSYKWLKEYIDFDLTPQQVSDALTSLGAPNVAAGQKVIVATIGTKLYDGDQEFVIKKSKLRGVESYGMICAEDEIGVGTDHNGIIVLPNDAQVGMPAAQYYGVESDWLIEVDLTPNRIDGASHYGVARDLSAWMKRHGMATRLHRPSVEAFKIDRRDGGIPVEVENAEACPRYCGLTVRNVKVGESPKWLKDYLSAVGQRPINNIVDITNYILLGTGQPMHCFDLSKVKGDKIVVKTVKEGTKFVTLDGVERTLTDRDLMICNAEEPMCIGGVFGGLDSGVTEATTDIFLESAYFHPTWIRKSARRFGLNTDASFRFERGIDPNDTIYNLKLAALLVKQLAGGETCGEIVDVKAHDFPPFPVELRYDYVTGLIGKNIGHDTIKSIVESLEMKVVAEDAERLSLEVPTYRVDVRRPCDVVEDILRVYGYNNVEFTDEIHGCLSNKDDADLRNDLRELISNQLTSEGYNEIMNNSLTAASYYEGLESYPVEHCVRVINALSSDLNVMRQTLLFGGLESLARNINRKNANLRMYEFGDVYSYDATADNSQVALAPYSEHTALGMWLTGNNHDDSWADKVRPLSVYDLKAAVAGVMRRLGIARHELVVETMSNDLLDPALVYKNRGGKLLGVLGVVDEAVASKFDVDQPVYFAQFNWNLLCKLSSKKEVKYTDLPKTLPLRRDLALLVDKSVTYAQIEHVVEQSERKLLKSMTLFDVYEGKNLEPGKKSYAISMVLQDDQKTLNDHQIEAVMKKIVANLEKQLGAQLR